MQRQPVVSSLLRSVGYDPASSVLEVELIEPGHVYEYFDVPYSVFEELMNADSLGSYFNEFIKDLYPYRRVV